MYGVDAGGDERFQLRMLDGVGERFVKLTDDTGVIHNWGDWSPDETKICFSSNARNPAFFDIYVQAVNGAAPPELVHQFDGNSYPLAWSPDGGSILFTRMHAPFNHDLYMLNLKDRSAALLTPHDGDAAYYSPAFDPSGRFIYCITDEGREFAGLSRLDVRGRSLSYIYTEEWELESLASSADGTTLAFTANRDGYSRLMIWAVGSGAPVPVSTPDGVIGGLTWSNRGDKLAFTLSSSSLNSDVWLYHLRDGTLGRVTHSSTCGVAESSFVEAMLFRYKFIRRSRGPRLPLYTQAAGEAGRQPFPLLLYLHGGPESQFRPGFSPLIQYLVRLGFAVLAPNFRGSTGYGRRYTHLDDVHNRMDTVKDSIAAVLEAQKMIPVDSSKIVAWGGSYGGFMVLACLYSKPDMWAAGVDIVGISNFVTFLKNTGPWRRKLREAEYGDPEKDRAFLEGISPLTNAHLIKAPLFIIHGANDPRVPAGEAGQIMQTMQTLGREAHLLRFEDEGHGLVKLQNRIEGYSRALDFLAYHLGTTITDAIRPTTSGDRAPGL